MKEIRVFITVLGLLSWLSNSAQTLNTSTIDRISFSEKNFHQLYFQKTNSSSKIDIHYNRFNLEVDPSIKYVSGSVFTRFTHVEPQGQIQLDLTSHLTVDSVIYNNQQIGFNHSNDVLEIPLPQQASGIDSVLIYYQGEPPTENESFVTDYHNNTPIMWTLSEPYGSKDWWPCNNNLGERIDSLDIWITCPIGNSVASLGVLVDSTQNGNTTTFHWKHRHAIPTYLMAFAVTNYLQIHDSVQLPDGNLKIQHFIYPEDSLLLKPGIDRTGSIIKQYDSLLGTYPCIDEKYGHAQFERIGGMEHNTISFMSDLEPELLAHELIHHWFGNKITCGSWSDIWLNEGITNYLAALVYKRYYDRDYYSDWKRLAKERVLSEPDGSVYVYDTTDASRVFDSRLTYLKGAFVMLMLREKLGETIFQQGLINYLYDSSYTNNFVHTTDLIHHFEATAQQDLSTFFNQWVFEQGYPILNLNWSQENNLVSVNWNQRTSHVGTPSFSFPLTLRFYNRAGQSQDVSINITGESGSDQFVLPFKVDSILTDPEDIMLVEVPLIVNNDTKDKILMGPNPATNHVLLQCGHPQNNLVDVVIYNISGAVVFEKYNINQNSIEINTSNWPAGNFLIKASDFQNNHQFNLTISSH